MIEDGNQLLSSADDERAIVTPPPASCADLAQLGNRIAGFYLVLDEESNNRIKTVYCDFSLSITNPGIYFISIFKFSLSSYHSNT